MHPDLKLLDKELQDNRYKHQEDKRNNRISMAKERRAELIQNNFSPNSPTKKVNSKNLEGDSVTLLNPGSTAIREEQKRLERLKSKQIWELQNLIDFEFTMEETRRKNEEKLRYQKEKEEKLKMDKHKKAMELSHKREMKEKEREKKLKEESEEALKKQREFADLEAKKRAEEHKRKEIEDKEHRKNQIEQKKKDEEFRRGVEAIFDQQQKELKEKQRELDEKEEIRKKNLEMVRNEKLTKAIKNSEKNKLKITKTLANNDDKMREQKEVNFFNTGINFLKKFF
jgi:trichohyalin